MIYTGTESNIRPPRVTIENLPGGMKSVRLTDNVREIVAEDGTFYVYDESEFKIKDKITAELIESDFDTYWSRGLAADQEPESKTLTRTQLTELVREQGEQITALEDALLEMSEKVYK